MAHRKTSPRKAGRPQRKAVRPAATPARSAARKPAPAAPKPAPAAPSGSRSRAKGLSPSALALLETARIHLGAASVEDVAALAASIIGQLGRRPDPKDRVVPVVLDGTKKDYLLADSRNRKMRGWHGTEADLLTHVAAETGQSEHTIVRSGVLFGVKRALSAASRASLLQNTTGSERRGVLGVNDAAFKDALARLRERGKAITPTTLATEARVNGGYRQAKRYMERMEIPETPAVTPVNAGAAANP
jgi:hypothetical protein